MTGTKFITEAQAVEITNLSKAWFRRARWEGNGPPFVKLGTGKHGSVRYPEQAFFDWFKSKTVGSTSEKQGA